MERNGTGHYVFPFAEDLEEILEPNKPKTDSQVSAASAEDAVNTELLGTRQNRPLVPPGTFPRPVPNP